MSLLRLDQLKMARYEALATPAMEQITLGLGERGAAVRVVPAVCGEIARSERVPRLPRMHGRHG
jgi:hypothetical protein